MSRLSLASLLLLAVPLVAPGQSAPDSGDVVINEVMYAPSPSSNEFIELYNRSEQSVNLNRLAYADNGRDFALVASSDTMLAPDQYVVLVRDTTAFNDDFPSVSFLAPDGWDALNNGGDTVILRDSSSGTTIDEVPYESSWGGDDGNSLERIDPAGPSDRASNFGTSEAGAGATPAARNSIFDPDETPPTLERVQPTPDGDSLLARFSEPLDAETASASAFSLDGSGTPAVETATVSDTAAAQVVCTLAQSLATGTFTLVAADVADRQGNVQPETEASFRYFVPETPASKDVVITELLYAPAPAATEFIEVYNRSEKTIDLGALEYADSDRDFDRLAPRLTPIEPDSHVVIVRDAGAFESTFPDAPFRAPDGWDALNNGGDTVVLRHAPSATVLDEVPYESSWGGDDGNSLERIDPAGPSNRASNFGTSEAGAGATPAARNSIFDPDESPPTLERVQPTPEGDSLLTRFSEPLDKETISASAFSLDGSGAPAVETATVSDTAAAQVVCTLAQSLATGTFTLVAADVADRQGNVQPETEASFRYFVPETPASKDLVITELLYAPAPTATEFIEVYNRSEKIVDLGALEYADEDRDFDRLAPRLTPVGPDSHVVIVREAAAFASAFPDASFRAPGGWDALNNGGDTVVLRHAPSATVLDEVPYESSWGGNDGQSLERIDPAGPSDASNFGTSEAKAGATPAARNSIFNPDEAAPSPVFAEQVEETNVVVTFSEPLQPASVTANTFTVASTTVTDARLRSDTLVVLSLAAPPSSSTVQVNGVRDRVGNALTDGTVALAYQPRDSQIVVNELLFDPRSDDFDDRPNQVEYVEIYNRTERPLTLRGLFATDRPDENGVSDTTRAGHRTALAPHGYGVVAAAPTGAQAADSSQLAAAFPNAPLAADSVAFLPVDARRLGLGNDGDLVRLHRADGTPIAEVSYVPDWHAAGLDDTKGTALERISPSGGASSPDNWTSSTDPTGGTPGRKNAVSLAPSKDAPGTGLQIEPSPFSVERDGATRIRYTLDDVPNLVRARIFDARGRKVRILEDARLAGRTGELIWNGRNDDGNRVRVGVYVVLFEAVRASGGIVTQFKKPVVVARPLN